MGPRAVLMAWATLTICMTAVLCPPERFFGGTLTLLEALLTAILMGGSLVAVTLAVAAVEHLCKPKAKSL